MSGAPWPLDLHARDVLKLPGETVIPWAVFDWQWYIRAHPDAASLVDGDEPAEVLGHYLDSGQRQGHSPNRFFDEQWHRQRYPRIAELLATGTWASAFDAYCRRGALDRSAHWLFDELAYRDRYEDLTSEALAEYQLVNGYHHYLRSGVFEGRIGHFLFDPAIYLANFDTADAESIRKSGAFQHYLVRIESGEPELRTSIYFDPTWYTKRYPEVAREIVARRWKCALHHYLCNDTPSAFDPLEGFSESWYLRRDPGLLEVIAGRSYRNGYMHFLRFGAAELRPPSDAIDLVWYAAQPSVKADLREGRAANAFAHWLTIGAAAGLRATKPETQEITSGQAKHLSHLEATALLPIVGRFGYRFDVDDEPAVSVVMVVRDGFAATMATIASLRYSTALDLELIVVDCGSVDETRSIGQYVAGAKVLRFETGLDWSRAVDAGRLLAGAPAVLFLSCGARIAPGSVDRACAHLNVDASVGAVGGMILNAQGSIAQAGGILWNDGSTCDYRFGKSPLDPEANFVRTVDFCSPAFLLVRAALLLGLDGLDHDCPPGYAAVDLCLRIAGAGSRVVYDPSVMITVDDAVASGGAPDAYFLDKHATALAQRFAPGGAVQVFARRAGAKPHSLLFIEDTVPLRRIGSGFVRSNDLVSVIASLGFAVTVFPMNGSDHDVARVFGDMPASVEVMHTLGLDDLAKFLEERAGYYDTVWVARTHNLAKARPILTRLTAEGLLKASIVLDTEAVTPARDAVKAGLAGAAYDFDAAMRAILADADICQQVVAVTAAEADILRSHGFLRVQVIGHTIGTHPTPRPFARRSGLLFVGAIHKDDSPNLDSLIWFVDRVLPLIEADLGWETRLTIAGYTAPDVDLSRFAQHPRITLRGPAADLVPLYNTHRVFVAPTRYAAGAPYKVLEAASHGVPVVATEVLRGQLGWGDGEILAADVDDPESFAAHVIALYHDEMLWEWVRDGALRRLRAEYGREDFTAGVAAVLLRLPWF